VVSCIKGLCDTLDTPVFRSERRLRETHENRNFSKLHWVFPQPFMHAGCNIQVMKYKRLIRGACLALSLFFGHALLGQNETTKWYFGEYVALDFMTNPPTPMFNSAMTAGEGCASMADAAGNLLFYTNYDVIYNSQHIPMANGTGLIGNPSTTQAALIVKQPGSSSLYYVFMQSGSGFGAYEGFHYSIVDMSLAAGMGSVTVKNVPLYVDLIWGMTEKLCGVRHCNGVDVWILTHDMASNNFRCFLLTAAGINPTPVISAVGAAPGTGACNNCQLGDMKVSPNGRKVGVAHVNLALELLDFDPATGILSNPLNLGLPNGAGYSCEFSPDGSKFYNTSRDQTVSVLQWDLCAGSNAAILASQATITVPFGGDNGALQLAPDGKIYTVIVLGFQSLSVGVVNNPNLSGAACNYVYPGISIAPRLSAWGLPNFMSSFFLPKPPPFTYVVNPAVSCQTSFFTAPSVVIGGVCNSSSFLYNSLSWDFGDPASGAANTSALQNPTHNFSAAGTYTVKLLLFRACGVDTLSDVITIAPTVSVSMASSPASCINGGSATVTANGNGSFNYQWMPSGNTASVVTGLNPDVYSVTVSEPGLCPTTATVLISLQSNMSGTVLPSSVPCPGGGSTGSAAILLSGSSGPYTYTWNGSPQVNPAVTGLAPGLHTVSVSGLINGCVVTLTFHIANSGTITGLPPLSACENSGVKLSTPFKGNAFHWTGPGSFSSHYQEAFIPNVSASMSGVYTLTASDANYCSITSTLALTVHPAPTAELFSSKNNLCAPYCTEIKTNINAKGGAITKTSYLVDERPVEAFQSIYCFTDPGYHLLTLSCEDENTCKGFAQLYIQAYPRPVADFQLFPQEPVVGKDEVLFTNTSSGEQQISWQWYLGGSNKPVSLDKDVSWLFQNTGTQTMAMVVWNAWGCADTMIKTVQVLEDFCFYVPNAFTPNDDGRNEFFQVKGIGITAFELRIFDRWGECIFHSNDQETAWDGTYKGAVCKSDVYAWKIKATGVNTKSKSLQGHVTLYR
jgi:gliding motility-associated-like protein